MAHQGDYLLTWWACSQTLLARLHAQLGSNPAAVAAVRDLTTLWTHLKVKRGDNDRVKDPPLTTPAFPFDASDQGFRVPLGRVTVDPLLVRVTDLMHYDGVMFEV